MIKPTMGSLKSIAIVSTFLLLPLMAEAQKTDEAVGPIRSSAAYAEVLLRKTELQAELEAILPDYTEENPKVIDGRFEIGVLTRDIDRIYAVRPSEIGKLTLALGKLIVKRAAFETELQRLLRTYNKDHPDVKRAKRRVEIFDSSIKQILG